MRTLKTMVTVHGKSVDITEDQMVAIFARYRQIEDVSTIISKAVIYTGDFVLQVTMSRKNVPEIPTF